MALDSLTEEKPADVDIYFLAVACIFTVLGMSVGKDSVAAVVVEVIGDSFGIYVKLAEDRIDTSLVSGDWLLRG